nr:unnamed protein product [Spirometra erinaceieuropaei]
MFALPTHNLRTNWSRWTPSDPMWHQPDNIYISSPSLAPAKIPAPTSTPRQLSPSIHTTRQAPSSPPTAAASITTTTTSRTPPAMGRHPPSTAINTPTSSDVDLVHTYPHGN